MSRFALIPAVLAVFAAPAVHAGDSAQPGAASAAAAVVEEKPPGIVLTVSRAADLDGHSRALITVVSTRPDIPDAAGGPVGTPAGSPLAKSRVSSRFGLRYHPITGRWRRHAGIDLAASHGTPVRSTAAGKVVRAGYYGGYGNLVVIRHGDGVETRYAHLSRIAVGSGQAIKDGQLIGYVGSTGRSTGPHLHYEIRRDGHAHDPAGSLAR